MDDTNRREETAGPQAGGKNDTAEYSGSKAPDLRPAVTQEERSGDPRLLPGGARRASAQVGMSEMNRDDVPNGAERTGLVHYGDTEDEDPT